MEQPFNLRLMILTSAITALIIVGAYIALPVPGSPVPVVMANLFVILGGLLLGARWGFFAAVLYLFLGALGLPVFANGSGGFVHLIGPTGGYLFGYAIGALVTGFISQKVKRTFVLDTIAATVGILSIFILGIPWLMISTGMSFNETLVAGLIPFIPGAILKIIIAVGLNRILSPFVNGLIEQGG